MLLLLLPLSVSVIFVAVLSKTKTLCIALKGTTHTFKWLLLLLSLHPSLSLFFIILSRYISPSLPKLLALVAEQLKQCNVGIPTLLVFAIDRWIAKSTTSTASALEMYFAFHKSSSVPVIRINPAACSAACALDEFMSLFVGVFIHFFLFFLLSKMSKCKWLFTSARHKHALLLHVRELCSLRTHHPESNV